MGGQGVFLLAVFFPPSGISARFLCDWSARKTGAFFFFNEKPSRDWGKQGWPAGKQSVSWTGTRSWVLELEYDRSLLDQIRFRAQSWVLSSSEPDWLQCYWEVIGKYRCATRTHNRTLTPRLDANIRLPVSGERLLLALTEVHMDQKPVEISQFPHPFEILLTKHAHSLAPQLQKRPNWGYSCNP